MLVELSCLDCGMARELFLTFYCPSAPFEPHDSKSKEFSVIGDPLKCADRFSEFFQRETVYCSPDPGLSTSSQTGPWSCCWRFSPVDQGKWGIYQRNTVCKSPLNKFWKMMAVRGRMRILESPWCPIIQWIYKQTLICKLRITVSKAKLPCPWKSCLGYYLKTFSHVPHISA